MPLCVRGDKGHRLIHQSGGSLGGGWASDISGRHDWNKGRGGGVCLSVGVGVGVCAKGREGAEGVFVCPGGLCRRLLPNPINSFWMRSFV